MSIQVSKLKQNDAKELKWLLISLLPYINEDYEKMSDIKSLNEIYKKKRDISDSDISSNI